MPIVNSQVSSQEEQATGYKVKFKYTFADGREFFIGPVRATNQDQITQLLESKKSTLESSVKSNDAQEAKELGLKTPYKDASQADVYFAYLYEGYNNDDALESYLLMSPVAQDILDIGLTVEQMAAMFNETVEMVNDVLAKWEYLDLHSVEILAYQSINGGM